MSRKQAYEYWYYFRCQNKPIKLSKGDNPIPPFKRFNSKKECQDYIDKQEEKKPPACEIREPINKEVVDEFRSQNIV